MKVVLTGGGTLGHVIPALSVAAALRAADKDIRLIYIGSRKENERRCVEEKGITFHSISSGKLRRYFSLENFSDLFRILSGFTQALRILRRERPDVVFSKGGYVSVPVVLAAHVLGIPSVTHESDRTLGLANRINARYCDKVCLGFDTVKGDKYVYTGNPVREDILTAEASLQERPLILVLGGSQGAVEINNLVYRNLEALTALGDVFHQAGAKGDFSLVKSNYKQVEFISEALPSLMKSASLVISRSGANAITELMAAEAVMLLIPLRRNASRGDQLENAAYLEKEGAALVLESEEEFLPLAERLLEDEELRSRLRKNCRRLFRGDAAERIASIIIEEGRS